ncbi:unnamed protein product [Allacma fusca]|uniref:Mitochondrial pyruvate carrier n=1 Tax=Allacma fusca TaxID=39272 RepID=A0A8J2Q7I9_9HEXA|nr:unnamed protein product [Allacma fusca]
MTSAVYLRSMKFFEKFVPAKMLPMWKHPAGPQTVFFWAPLFKWGLVIAGLGDLSRPAEKISLPQAGALAATGFIWSRYSLVIIPKNWSLCSVNFFVGLTAAYSCVRSIKYQMSIKDKEE